MWTIRKHNDEHRQPASRALQENNEKETKRGICLLSCLTGHTGNIHTVAFSKADMLVSGNSINVIFCDKFRDVMWLSVLDFLLVALSHIYDQEKSE